MDPSDPVHRWAGCGPGSPGRAPHPPQELLIEVAGPRTQPRLPGTIAREGVLALTVKALADEAGVPVSSMRYTMPSQAVVRERALEAIARSIRDRINALPVNLDGGPERARALLTALLPLDADRRLEASVLLTLSGSALTEPGLQPIWREVDGTIRDVCAQALIALGVRGDVVAPDHLHTFITGLTVQLMNRGEGRSPQWALSALDQELLRHGTAL